MTANRLIAQMLAARDRWPPHVYTDDAIALRADVERALECEIGAAIAAVRARMPDALATTLPAHARIAGDHFALHAAPPPHAPVVIALGQSGALPDHDDHPAWLALADWLLTKGGTFTTPKGVRVTQGFPAAGSGAGSLERAQRKAEFARWLVDAADVPGLA